MCCMKKSNQNTSTYRRSGDSPVARLVNFADTRARAMLSAYHMAWQYFAVEGIHEFRTEVKQRRALLQVFKPADIPDAITDSLKVPRTLYRASGRLRDIDICQEILLSELAAVDVSQVLNSLKHTELKRRAEFASIARKIHLLPASSLRRMVARALRGFSNEQIRAMVVHRILILADQLSKAGSVGIKGADRIHEYRKIAKSLKYTLDIWQHCFGEKPQVTRFEKTLRHVYGIFGTWRDLLLAEEALGEVSDKGKSGTGRREATDLSLQKKYRARRKALRREFIECLPALQSELGALINGFVAGSRSAGEAAPRHNAKLAIQQ